jgi:hypothetical protein
MNNITEKYNGKNGLEGSIIHFKITKYEIDLLQKTIFVKYDMIVENSLADNVIVVNKKSYIRQDIQGKTVVNTNEITPPTFDENGNIIVEGVYEDVEVVTVEENLAFSSYQNFPLQYGVDNGLVTLEDVFFVSTTEHILYVHGYSEEDLFVKNTEESE